jgi:hypothetical protein
MHQYAEKELQAARDRIAAATAAHQRATAELESDQRRAADAEVERVDVLARAESARVVRCFVCCFFVL